jgi:regulator of sigma E protease
MDAILGFLQTIGPFLFVLGVLIFVHELGHFLVARWYGVKVLAFSLGFGPKLFKVTRGDTEYCISAIPLGGYVKLAGETAEDKPSGDPTEFLSKSKWVRFQVYLAGPVMNIALALILTTVVLTQGADEPLYRSASPVIGAVAENSVAQRAGIQVGDRVVRVNETQVDSWDQFDFAVMTKANREVTMVVERGGAFIDLRVTPEAEGRFEIGTLGVLPVIRPQVMVVNPGTPAAQAGFQRGDVLLGFNGDRGLTREALIARIQKSPNTPVTFTIERAGVVQDVTVTPMLSGEIGIVGMQIGSYETRRIDPGIVDAARMSVDQTWESSKQIGTTLAGLFTRETPVNQLMGPVAIAEISGATAQLGWVALLSLMAMISLNLGLLNLMPIPVLDGGHIAILALEGLARRDFSVKLKERVLMVGLVAILMLMVTVIFNDVARLLR